MAVACLQWQSCLRRSSKNLGEIKLHFLEETSELTPRVKMITGMAGCKDPCRSQSATWDELLPAWNNPEGKAQSWEATWAHIRAPGNSGKVCINVNTFYLFITNSLFGRGDGNPPRQSNYIIEDWENLWVPLLISTVSWTVRPTITRSGESAARHKQLTDVTVLYKYKRQHLSPRRLHAANAHASIAAESFSQEASDLLS